MFARVEPARQGFKVLDDYSLEDIIENKEFLRELFFEYSQYNFPKWKRLEFSNFEKIPVKKYVGNFIKTGSVLLSKDALKIKEDKELLLKKFNGVDPKFTLMALIFFNSGIFGNIDKDSKITLKYDMNENQSVLENSALTVHDNVSVTLVREYGSGGKFLNSATPILKKKAES